jgi:hypothetical protein
MFALCRYKGVDFFLWHLTHKEDTQQQERLGSEIEHHQPSLLQLTGFARSSCFRNLSDGERLNSVKTT